jgi:hypothetical protein
MGIMYNYKNNYLYGKVIEIKNELIEEKWNVLLDVLI